MIGLAFSKALSKLKLIPDWAWVLFIMALVLLAIQLWVSGRFDDGRKVGAAELQAQVQGQIITNVEAANAEKAKFRNPAGRTLYDECLLSARTPSSCERFLPD